jgi:hypothetical protein
MTKRDAIIAAFTFMLMACDLANKESHYDILARHLEAAAREGRLLSDAEAAAEKKASEMPA